MLGMKVYQYGDHDYGCQCDDCLMAERTIKLELAEEECERLTQENKRLQAELEAVRQAASDLLEVGPPYHDNWAKWMCCMGWPGHNEGCPFVALKQAIARQHSAE